MKKILLTSFVAASAVLVACGGGETADTSPKSTASTNAISMPSGFNTVMWQDDFSTYSGSTPDATKWAMLTGNGTEYGNTGWGNNELEYYLPSDATVANGSLQIHGHANSVAGFNYSSARVTSVQSIDLSQAGFLEVKAQLPTAAGSWPAIWLLPGKTPGQAFPPSQTQLNLQPTWPVGGEIDMAEYLSKYFSSNLTVQSTLHLPSGTSAPYADQYIYKKATLSSAIDSNFHLYQLKWNAQAQEIDFSIDNTLVMACTKSSLTCTPSDGNAGLTLPSWPYGATYTNYYLLLNLAIGGNLASTPPTTYNQTMNVAYVRYLKP